MRFGVVGVGCMGVNHVRVLSSMQDGVELLGIYDVDKSRCQMVAKQFQVKSFPDLQSLCGKVDAMVVATPTGTHYPVVEECLRNNCHVLVEKPICDTVEHARLLVERFDDNGCLLGVGHVERHNPVVRELKKLCVNKTLGSVVSMCSKRVSKLDRDICDVGVIYDLGIHDIDVMRFLNGDVKSVYAVGGLYDAPALHENHACVVLRFDNGVYGWVETNWLTPMVIRKLCMTCSDGYVEADYMDQSFMVSTARFEAGGMNLFQVPVRHSRNVLVLDRQEPLRNELVDFVGAVKRHKPVLCSGRDGLWALHVAEAAVRSFRSGEVVSLW